MIVGDDSNAEASDPGTAPPDPVPEDRPRYERQGLIGQGGMGRVYAAHDPRLRRQVAQKVAATPELAGRLAREAAITAQLEHPGIVAVYDAGQTDGQAWYTMRLIRGRTLRERLVACTTPASRLELLPHVHAACQAVAYAHAMGIVHRDLKPSNIMVGEFGETQVADWGLATPIEEALSHWQRIATEESPAAGTPRYMSPEQAAGAPPSRQADVYGLGVVLFELLSGRALPGGSSAAAALDGLPAIVPRELVAIVRRCVQASPEARYPSAAELAADLGRWLSGQRVSAHDYRPQELLLRLVRAWRGPLAATGAALVVVLGVVASAVDRVAEARATAEANLAVALAEQSLAALLDQRTPEANVLAAHALAYGPSPVARGILAATRRSPAQLLWRSAVPELCQHSGVLSPDATALACHANGTLEVWSTATMERRWAVDLNVVEAPVWIGKQLLVATPDTLEWIEDGVVVAVVAGEAWWPLAAGWAAFATRGPQARFLPPGGSAVDFDICMATRATVRVVGPELVVGCDDGMLRRYGADGAVTLELPLGERPAWAALSSGEDALLVGRLDGAVHTLALPGGAVGRPVAGRSAGLRALQPVPGTRMVLVLPERGGPRIWNTDAGEWVGSLPSGATGMFPGTEPGDVWLLGQTLQRWHVAAEPGLTAFSFATGVAHATPSPSGNAFAVALGSGDVVERRLSDGEALRQWRLGNSVAKCVAYSADDARLLAGAMDSSPTVLGPAAELLPIAAGVVLRRVGGLSDGRMWALPYSNTVLMISPASREVRTQEVGPGPMDGSSSPLGGTAAIVDQLGGIWVLEGSTWREVAREADAIAVDVGEGGTPLVVGRRREVCIDRRCLPVEDDVIDVSISGDLVAVGMLSGDILLVRVATGKQVALLRGHRSRVSSVEFGPGGAWLLSGSWDGTARVWDLAGLDEPAEMLIAAAERNWGITLAEAMRSR